MQSGNPKRKALVVSIHDVCPQSREVCEQALAALSEDGVKSCSLLVVPDHHRKGHFLDDRVFCRWLHDRAAAGDEIVIHGYHHLRERRSGESPFDQAVTRFYTAGEGEFFDLKRHEAEQLLERAKAEFRMLGLRPSGFIAPAWLLGLAAEAAVRSAGFRYTTRLGTVLRFADGAQWRSQSLVWSVRSGWRRAVSLRWNALLFQRLEKTSLLRVGLHPPDLAHPGVWNQARELIRRALVEREAITYERWVRRDQRPGPP